MRDERGFACVRVADEAGIGQQLQFETQAAEVTGAAGLVFRGRLMGGSGKPGVAAAAAATARHHPGLAIVREVEELFPGFVVENRGSDRHLDSDAFAIVPGSVAAFAVAAALGGVLGIEAEMQEGIAVDGSDHGDVAAATAIAAARAATGDVLLPAKGQTAVAAIPGLDGNSCFVDEHQIKAAGAYSKQK